MLLSRVACDNRSLIVERLSTHVSLVYYSKPYANAENAHQFGAGEGVESRRGGDSGTFYAREGDSVARSKGV